jgi:hypothetical protein
MRGPCEINQYATRLGATLLGYRMEGFMNSVALLSATKAMNVSEFLRLYPMRSPNLMWLLGAGASAAAGISTAYHMIWEFKRAIYCSTQRVPLSACSDLSNSIVRTKIQQHFDSLSGAPKEDAAEEYSFYFDLAYSSEADRRKYIDQSVAKAKPSYGHCGWIKRGSFGPPILIE